MKFNYRLYRPKKFIQDVRPGSSPYFRSSDVRVTPLTKIGDAEATLDSRLQPKPPTLRSVLARRFIEIRDASRRPQKIRVRVLGDEDRQSFVPQLALAKLRTLGPLISAKTLMVGAALIMAGAGFGGFQLVNNSHPGSPKTTKPAHKAEAQKKQDTPPPKPQPPSAAAAPPPAPATPQGTGGNSTPAPSSNDTEYTAPKSKSPAQSAPAPATATAPPAQAPAAQQPADTGSSPSSPTPTDPSAPASTPTSPPPSQSVPPTTPASPTTSQPTPTLMPATPSN